MFEELEKLSSAPKNDGQPEPAKHRKRRSTKLVGTAVAIVAVVGLGVFGWRHFVYDKNAQSDSLPASTLSKISGFHPYYFKSSYSSDFKLQINSVIYQGGVLIFSMRDSAGKTLAFTEEATPPNYDISSLNADKQYSNAFGQAFITDDFDRTTGALFTTDNTWILVNAPQPIGSDLMQQTLDALQPVKSR